MSRSQSFKDQEIMSRHSYRTVSVTPPPACTSSPREKPSEISKANQQLFRDVRHIWSGPLHTHMYDDKLAEMSNQTRSHLFWLARNKQYHEKSQPQTARPSERPSSQSSWTKLSVMVTSPRNAALRHAEDLSSVMSTNSKVRSFCYLCSTIEEHQRNHLKSRAMTPVNKDGSVCDKRQRIRYVAPIPPCVKKKVEEPAVMVQEALYKVTVWTGDLPGASTNANVFITMVGDQGVLLKTRLWHRQGTNKFSFVRGSKEVFHIKGPKLGTLRTITIEHDGVELQHAWFLERVEVQCLLTRKVWMFQCKHWLSLHHGEPSIQRELQATIKECSVREFEVTVETGKKRFAGTEANVYIMLHGTEGSTRRQQLNSHQLGSACFLRGQTDRFKIQAPDIGEIRSLRIEHDGERATSSWYLNKVVVRDIHQPQCVYSFVCDGWLAKDMGDGRSWRELRAVKHVPNGLTSNKSVQYEVIVKTGDIYQAGTTGNLYVAFHGTNGKTGKLFLGDSTCTLERSKTESFTLKAANVGDLNSIKIGLDASGPEAGWFCDHIKVRKSLSRQEISEKLAQQKQAWKETKRQMTEKPFDQERENAIDNTSEEKAEKHGDTIVNVSDKTGSETPHRSADDGREAEYASVFGKNGKVLKIPLCKEYIFPCSQWFASGQDDGLFERELQVDKITVCYQLR